MDDKKKKERKTEETKTSKIVHLAMEKGDTGILDLIDRIWGDSFYDSLNISLDNLPEEEKDELLEELENELESKPVLYVDKRMFIEWYFDEDMKEEVIDTLTDPTGPGEARLIDLLQSSGYIPLCIIKNKENIRKEDIDTYYEGVDEPGELYRLEWEQEA